MTPPRFRAVVLAGERPDGSALARALDLPAAVLAPLAGRPSLERVLDALDEAGEIDGVRVCGPTREVVAASPVLGALLARDRVTWMPPSPGPAASALAGADAWGEFPVLLTAGDHGLLNAPLVDAFCRQARASQGHADVVVGLVPHALVRDAFPRSRRTVLAFSDGAFCGSNLFGLLEARGRRALAFWRSVEAERKRPWKMVQRLGPWTLLRYLARRLPVEEAFAALSRHAGCRVGWVPVSCARAAVDVDSEDDWRLADSLLTADAGPSPDADPAASGRNAPGETVDDRRP